MPPVKRPAILTDFDGTAAEQNVAEMLLEHFNHHSWKELRGQYSAGYLTLKDYQELGFRELTASRQELVRYVKDNATLREGFSDLAHFCKEKEIPLAIVTFGLDVYVDALLEKYSLEWLPRFSAGFHNGAQPARFSYPYATPWCWQRGNCKCLTMYQYVKQGHYTIYIGDGRSDLCPAQKANLVLARSTLLDICRNLGLPHREFHDFHQVKRLVQEEFGYD